MFLWNKHLQSSIFSKLIRNSTATIHTVTFIIKEQLLPHIVSNLLCFCRTGVVARKYNFDTSFISDMHIVREICYMMRSFPAIHFFYDRVIITRKHLKWFICQGNCVYFTTIAAAIHYNKRSVVDLRNVEGYVYLRKNIKAESVTTESLDNFLKGSKNGFHGNALADFKTYVLQVWFIWEVKIKDTYHLQSWRQLAFQQMWKCFYSIMICTDTDNYVKVLSTIKKETKNLCSFKVANLFHRTSCSNCEKYCVKCTKALPAISFMWMC